MRKYFKFIKLKKSWRPFILLMIMNIIGQCYDEWSIYQIIKSNFIIMITWILGTLVIDWFQIKSENSKDRNSKE